MRKSFHLSTLALAAALLVAPALAQNVPDPLAPAAAREAAPVAPATAPQSTPAWWLALGDATLSALIEQGLQGNLDLAQAQARLQRSQALLGGARAAAGPSGSAGLQARAVQASESEAPGRARAQRRNDAVQLGLDFSWELDLFGRLQAHTGAAAQRVRASQAQAQGVRLAVSTEIAQAYFALLGAREQLALAETVLANRERTLALVALRAQRGLAAPIDDARARAELEAAQAEIPVHTAAARVATHRLAVLTGTSPTGFEVPAAPTAPPEAIAIPLPAPGQWLSQRPDVQALEAELRASALDVAAVRAEFLPRLSVSGVLGFVSGSLAALGSAGTVSWLAAPSLLAPVFDRPRIQARLDGARAQQRETLAAYHQRLLLATEEVENALASYAAGQQQLQALQQRALHAGQAQRLARLRYEAGATDLLELLDTQRMAQQAQAAQAQALMRQRQALVAVFKGLGAGTGGGRLDPGPDGGLTFPWGQG